MKSSQVLLKNKRGNALQLIQQAGITLIPKLKPSQEKKLPSNIAYQNSQKISQMSNGKFNLKNIKIISIMIK